MGDCGDWGRGEGGGICRAHGWWRRLWRTARGRANTKTALLKASARRSVVALPGKPKVPALPGKATPALPSIVPVPALPGKAEGKGAGKLRLSGSSFS